MVSGPAALIPRYGDGYVVIDCRHDTICVSVARISVVRHVGDVIDFNIPSCTGYLHSVSPRARATARTRYRHRNRTGTRAAGSQGPCAFGFPTRLYLVFILGKHEYISLLRDQFVHLNLKIDI